MKFKQILISGAIVSALGLSGCGGSASSTPTGTAPDDGGGTTPVSTAFTVNVQVPDGLGATQVASVSSSLFADFFISEAAAATVSNDLGEGNFKVAIVDAAGVVQEIVVPESISQEPDGSWIVILAGGTRVDCVIIADVSKTPDVQIGQTLPADAIYSPTASEQFDIDIRSTSAFQEFIEAVEDNLNLQTGSGFSEEEVTALVTKAQELPLPPYTAGQTLEQYLVTALPVLETAIEREIVVVKNTDASFSLANYVQNGGIINWFYGESEFGFFERGQFSFDTVSGITTDVSQSYDSSSNIWIEDQVTAEFDGLILTSTGWQPNADLDEFESFNADGSITLADTQVNSDKETISGTKVDVAGQRIGLFVPGFATGINNVATFSVGAEAYLLTFVVTLDTYEIWADEFEGTVTAYERYNGTYNVITTLNEMFSATAANSTDPEQMNLVRTYPNAVELIGSPSDSTGTVNIIAIDDGTFPSVASVIGTTTWERRTVNGKDIVLIAATGTALQDGDDAGFYMLTVYPDNYAGIPAVVEGRFSPAGVDNNDVDYVFNDIAAQDINENFTFTANPAPNPNPTPGALACGYDSGWNDLTDEPATFNSFNEFESVIAACGGKVAITKADYDDTTWVDEYTDIDGITYQQTLQLDANGLATLSETTIQVNGNSSSDGFSGIWSISNNLLTVSSGTTTDILAVTVDGAVKLYTEQLSWSSTPDLTISDPSVAEGEIWTADFQPATTPPPTTTSLDCGYSSGWDNLLDQPATFNSYTDFEEVLTDCGSLVLAITDTDIIGTWVDSYGDADGDWVETLVFSANGVVNYTESLNGVQVDTASGNWAVSSNRLTLTIESLYKEVGAFLSNGTQKFYDEATDWTPPSDLILDGDADGEIWTGFYVKQLP